MLRPELEGLSKYISYLLRHHPETLKLKMDKQGWVKVDELIEKINETRVEKIDLDILLEIVRENNKQRFAIRENNWGMFIRANQGHTLKEVDMKFKAVMPPKVLYHGTGKKSVKSILEKGILAGRRQHVHLSSDIETAVNVGSRHGYPKVFEVNAEQMNKDGVEFYLSENNVWLTNFVDKKYIRVIR